MKVYFREVLWVFIIYTFAFQRALTRVWHGFNYLDELFALYTIAIVLVKLLKNGRGFYTKKEYQVLILWFAVIILGLIGNRFSKVLNIPYLIFVDILSSIKVWLSYYIIISLGQKEIFFNRIIQYSAKIGRVITWIMLICLLISQVIDIGMTSDVSIRYGIASYQFVFNVPGNFSKFFYFLMPVLTADLYYKNTISKRLCIMFALIVWAFTLRSRAFAFIAIYVLAYIIFLTNKGNKAGQRIKNRVKPWHIVVLAIIIVVLTRDKLIFYFTTSTQARNVLLRYGILTMMRYIPLGAGFGTFGSDVASSNYSKLYTQYGFNNYYGMREGEELFLNDNYWPMIMGQFGIIGLLLVVYIVVTFSIYLIRQVRTNKYLYFATFIAMGYLLASSVASKSYCEYSSICVFMLVAVFIKKERMHLKDSNSIPRHNNIE